MRERRFFRPLLIGSALAALLCLAPGPDASAVSVDEERSASFYQDALKQLQEGDAAAAIIQLRNALQRNPDNLDARLLLGRLYLRAGDGPSAEKELRRVMTARPDDETAILLGNALLLQNKFQDVLSEITPDASTPENHHQKLLLRGNAHFGLGEPDKAEALYDEILKAVPDSAGANLALARLRAAQGDLDSATDHLGTALESNPDLVEAWLLKAEIALRQKRFDAALEALDEADHIRPNDPRTLLARAQALLQSGKLDEGEAQVKAVLKQYPNQTFAKYLESGILFARGKYNDANQLFLTIQDELRDFTPALLLGGLIKFSTGQYAQSERWLTRYVTAQPDNAAAERLLALVRLRQDAPQSAIEVLEPMVAKNPDDLAAQRLLASGYMRIGKYDEAADIFEKISRSGNPAAVRQARTALALLGNSLGIGKVAPPPADGAAPGEGSALLGPDDLSKGILLVLDYLRTRDFEKALAEVESLKADHPDNPVLLNLEGGVYLAQGKDEEARKRFEQALKINPNFLSALTNLDRIDLRAGKPEAVEARMRERLERNPADKPMILRLAQFLASQKRPDDAQALLESGRQRLTEDTDIRRALILSYLSQGERERALPVAKELAGIATDDAQVLTFAGQAIIEAGAPADAVDVFRKAAALQPDSADAKLALANALFAAGQKEEARTVLLQIQEQNPESVGAATGLVNFALSDHKPDEAIRIADDLAAKDAVAGARLKANVLMRTDRKDEAVTLLTDAFKDHPVSALAIDLFLARRAVGQQGPAIAELKDWVGGHADDRPARLALASALLEAKDYAGAAKHYETLLSSNPNDAAILNNLAWLKNELGQPDAVEYARRAHNLAPESPEVADTLGWMLVQSEKGMSEGLALLREAASEAPGNPDIQYHLAYALHTAGKRDAAQQILEKLLATDQPFMERKAAQLLLSELRG